MKVSGKEQYVECADCGTLLNPIYVLQLLASKESYWRRHVEALTQHLKDLNEEIEGRMRTKCTHRKQRKNYEARDSRDVGGGQ